MASIYQGTAFIKGLRLAGSNDDNSGKPPKLYRGADQLFPKSVPFVAPPAELTRDVLIDGILPYPDPMTNWPYAGGMDHSAYSQAYWEDVVDPSHFYVDSRTGNNAEITDFVEQDGVLGFNFVSPEFATLRFEGLRNSALAGQITSLYVKANLTEAMADFTLANGESMEYETQKMLFGMSFLSEWNNSEDPNYRPLVEYPQVTLAGIQYAVANMFSSAKFQTVSQTDSSAHLYLPDLEFLHKAKYGVFNTFADTLSLTKIKRVGCGNCFWAFDGTLIDLSGLDTTFGIGEGAQANYYNAETNSYGVFDSIGANVVIRVPEHYRTSNGGQPDAELLAINTVGNTTAYNNIQYV